VQLIPVNVVNVARVEDDLDADPRKSAGSQNFSTPNLKSAA
jgi:hypothetical protein